MPIYAYACKECDHTLDALQKIADARLVDCPECSKPALKRLLSAPRFRLKGQGWYETDFKKDNQRNLHGDKDASTPKPKSDGKGDKGDKGGKSDKSDKGGKSADKSKGTA
jgi:putative FmdB family regulatory protein